MAGKGNYIKTGDANRYKDLLKKIGEHGAKEVEEILELETGQAQRTMKAERVLIILEMLYNKAVRGNNIAAAQLYLDRILGKPKESLNLTNSGDLIGKISDGELIDKITAIIKATRKGESGAAD